MRIRYTNTIDHVLAFQHHHTARSRRTATLIVSGLVAVALYRIYEPGRGRQLFMFAALYMALFMGFIWILNPLGSRLRLWLVSRKGRDKALLCEHTLELSPEGVRETTPVSSMFSHWQSIERVDVTKSYAFVYVQSSAAHVIPRAAVIEGDFDLFVQHLLEKISAARLPPPAPSK